jgi:WD40 repeat protein
MLTLSEVAPNDAPNQLAVLADEAGLHIATGTGRHVIIRSAEELGAVQHTLGPHQDAVQCVCWCKSHALLAVGAGHSVALYRRDDAAGFCYAFHKVAEVDHGQPVSVVEWTSLHGKPALWSGGHQLLLWAADPSGSWTVSWSCTLSQKVHLIAVSSDGTLLATAGKHDRMLKVWEYSHTLTESSQVVARSPVRLSRIHLLSHTHPFILLPVAHRHLRTSRCSLSATCLTLDHCVPSSGALLCGAVR